MLPRVQACRRQAWNLKSPPTTKTENTNTMKTDNDILTTYGLTSETRADGVTYRCKVKTKEGGIYCEGLGTTYAGAQDTAFYACAITARGYQPDIKNGRIQCGKRLKPRTPQA